MMPIYQPLLNDEQAAKVRRPVRSEAFYERYEDEQRTRIEWGHDVDRVKAKGRRNYLGWVCAFLGIVIVLGAMWIRVRL